MNADQIAEKIKATLIEKEVGVVMASLAISNGFAAALVSPIVTLIVTILVNKGELGVYYLASLKHSKDQAKKVEEKIKQRDKAVTDAEKKKAEQELIDAARDAIKWNR